MYSVRVTHAFASNFMSLFRSDSVHNKARLIFFRLLRASPLRFFCQIRGECDQISPFVNNMHALKRLRMKD